MKTWVKLYTEINHDPKLGTLSWAERGIWAGLLALAGEIDARDEADGETGELDRVEATAWRLRCDVPEFVAAVQVFIERGMLEVRGEVLFVVHYAERQKRAPSDSHERVRERVTRHRKQASNEDVTPLHENVTRVKRGVTSTESETEQSREEKNFAPPGVGAARDGPPKGSKPVTRVGPPTKAQVENQKRLALEEYCAVRLAIPRPEPVNDKQRAEAGELWWYPLRKILGMVDWDVGRAQELIDRAVAELDERQMTISSPKSILQTAIGIHGRNGRGGNHANGSGGSRGAGGGRGGSTDGWTREQIAAELERRERDGPVGV